MALREKYIQDLFSLLDSSNLEKVPPPGSLSDIFRRVVSPRMRTGSVKTSPIRPVQATLFPAAAVEMWQRAIHSFLFSVYAERTSVLWSAVSGYYASHYVMRAFCYLFGYCRLQPEGFFEAFIERGAMTIKKLENSNEHDKHWSLVSSNFADNDLFGKNEDKENRNYANYKDLIDRFSEFRGIPWVDVQVEIRRKVERISSLLPAVPKAKRFPDLANVHTAAFHRVCFFRDHIGKLLGGRSKYWNANKNPRWCANLMLYEPRGLSLGDIYSFKSDS